MIIKWCKSSDGYVTSKCGRFDICPEWHGTSTIQGYYLVDNDEQKWITISGDTQNELTHEAQRITDNEIKNHNAFIDSASN